LIKEPLFFKTKGGIGTFQIWSHTEKIDENDKIKIRNIGMLTLKWAWAICQHKKQHTFYINIFMHFELLNEENNKQRNYVKDKNCPCILSYMRKKILLMCLYNQNYRMFQTRFALFLIKINEVHVFLSIWIRYQNYRKWKSSTHTLLYFMLVSNKEICLWMSHWKHNSRLEKCLYMIFSDTQTDYLLHVVRNWISNTLLWIIRCLDTSSCKQR
jgi:hypothetical protein